MPKSSSKESAELPLQDCRLRFYRIEPYSAAAPASGKPTRIREFPHMAAIGWTEPDGSIQWKCGGSLIWDNFVLTAAHCVLDSRSIAPDVVRLGDIDLYSADDDEWAQQFRIAKIVRHPEHRFTASYNDIALLKLDRNVVEDGTVIPACLWRDEEVRFKELVATGWGRTGVGADFTPKLLQVSLKPISNEECSKIYPYDRKLRQGLQGQHLCARDEIMDTCEGDSGGPLQFKLMHNGRMTPFIIGVTSFGSACGVSLPGVYARVSTYFDWIVDTMRQHEAVGLEANYNETFCALRYVTFREYDKQVGKTIDGNYTSKDLTKLRIYAEDLPRQLARIRWNGQGPNCFGVIVDENTVLTVADCTTFNGKSPTFVTYLNNKVATISKIVVHPEHARGSAYNNIAILKLSNLLDLPLDFRPSCIWHSLDYEGLIYAYGRGRRDINRFIDYGEGSFLDPRQFNHLIQSHIMDASSCIVSERFLPRMTKGPGRDHLCVGNDVFLVPGSCEQLTGSMLGKPSGFFYNTVALTLLSRDCGFGEHLISTRLYSHVDWMKSVLLPNFRDFSAVHYVDADLQEGSSCTLGSGLTGLCVSADRCTEQLKQSQGRITFCSSGSTRIGWLANGTPQFHCMGSVVSRSSVLTTASCLGDSQPSIVQLTESGSQHEVDRVLKHPGFNVTDRTNDIALIRLKKPLTWSSSMVPICLWTNVTHTPIELDINYPSENSYYTPKKHHPMYGSDCQRTHPHVIRDSQLCTRSPYESAVCVTSGDQLIWADEDAKVRYLVGLSTNSCEQVKLKLFTCSI
ncbi:serine collagenase 1 [Culex quinquefasciatus]|uniref:Serine collagenase 1 n=1 Tax=Culex quinquefasciatus TaxID=7176 RepID=B0WA46_CULQU|nr:serine collagenase 1 [Culex quinquefasciatus]|eukprot:XP_001845580.1 serine collagenase 1 [Culex quinquefasciatus]